MIFKLILISREEKDIISSTLPNVYITIVNKTHSRKKKNYYMEADKRALRLIIDTNVSARRELIWLLSVELKNCHDKKRRQKIEDEIQELKKGL